MNFRALLPVRGLLYIAIWGTVWGPRPGMAQEVVPDDTLGSESSIVTPLDANTDRIDGGALRDSVLFHSFEGFSIPEGHAVYFANPEIVDTIFSRVTGGDPSRLFGTLGVLGEADLIFLNPNGVLFGPNAALDLQGAFTATTGTGVVFPGGEVFSAIAPEAMPLLTVDVQAPVGIVFEGADPAAIANSGNLAVTEEQGIALIGGVVVNDGTLTAPTGQVSLAAVPEDSSVQVGSQAQVLGWEDWVSSDADSLGDDPLAANELVSSLGINVVDELTTGTALVSGGVDASSPLSSGGTIQVLGDRVALVDGTLNASGLMGGGTVLVGGEYQGQGVLPSASQTYVGPDGAIVADAMQSGNGGDVIVWADLITGFHGNISARGGVNFGDGGFVEVSGRESLSFQGFVDAGATDGANGILLLDPRNIFIVEGAGDDVLDPVDNNGDQAIILPWEQASGTNFTIAEEALESIPENVDITLEAEQDIVIESLNGPDDDNDTELLFQNGPGGNITFIADANGDGTGVFTMESSDTIVARQRNIEILGTEITVGSINTAVPVSEEENPLPANGGSITLVAAGNITTTGVFDGNSDDDDSENPTFLPVTLGSNVSINRPGDGGKIELFSENGNIDTTSGIVVSTTSNGSGGEIIIQADGRIDTANVISFIQTDEGVGTGGRIEIISANGEINTTQGPVVALSPNGAGGEIFIEAEQDITTGVIRSSFGLGDSGNITLRSNSGNIETTPGLIGYLSPSDRDDVELIADGSVEFDFISGNNLSITGREISHLSSRIDANNSVRLTSTAGDITLNEVDASSLVANSNNAIFSNNSIDVSGTVLLTSTSGDIFLSRVITDDLRVDAGGIIIGNGVLTISGDASFTSQALDAGKVEITSQNDTAFGNSVIGGDLVINIDGQTSQTGVLQVAGGIVVNGVVNDGVNDPLINTVGNPSQEAILDDGSVVITRVGTVPLESANYPANLTVNSLPEGILGFDEVLQDTAIELSNSGNSFGGTVQFRTQIGDAETITGIPGITQSGPISVAGTAIFDATDIGNINLAAAGNQFEERVSFTGQDVDLVSSDGFELLDSTANGDLSIAAGGILSQAQNSSLVVLGATDLTTTHPNAGDVSLGNSTGILIGQSLIGGDLNLELESPNLSVRPVVGTTLRIAGTPDPLVLSDDFELDILPGNSFQVDEDGNIFITNIGAIDVTEILSTQGITDVNGSLTVNSLGEGLQFTGVYNQPAIELGNVENRLQGAIAIQTAASTIVEVSDTPEISQSAPLSVEETATFNAATGNVDLPDSANQFGAVVFEGVDVVIQEQDATILGDAVATGTLDLISGDSITQQGDLRVGGATTFTSLETDAAIVLDQSNQLAGPIAFNTEGNGDVNLTNTVFETQLAGASIGGNFTVDSGAGISQTGSLSIVGQATLNAGSNDIELPLANDFGSIAITGADTVTLEDVNNINLENSQSFGDFTVTAQGLVDTQDISITNGSIQLTSEAGAVDTTGGTLRARFASGQGGNVDIRANGNLTSGEILVNGFPSGSVSLTSETGTLLLDGYDIRSNTLGSGTGGGVTLNGDVVRLINGGRVTSSAVNNGTGGTVTVNARQFLIEGINNPNDSIDTASITGIGTDTFIDSAGRGGDQIINATELIQIAGAQPGEFTPNLIDQTAVLDAGLVSTGLTASSLGSEDAGDIRINTPRLVVQDGAGIATAALGTGSDAGAGGELDVIADTIEFRGLAGLATATLGAGAAGDIRIRGLGSTEADPVPANQVFLYDGAAITADAIPEAVQEVAELFEINPPSNIDSDTLETRAGNVDITANDILLDNRSRITTSSTAGDGGTITLSDVGALRLRRGLGIGGIFTDGGEGQDVGRGGGINITADGIFAVPQENSDISARAFIESGGGIDIELAIPPVGIAFRPDLTPFSDITAGSDQGPAGTVNIEDPGLDPTQGTQALPEEPQGPEVIEGCAVSANNQAAGFFDLGRGGKLPGPEDLVTADAIIAEWTSLDILDTVTFQSEPFSEDFQRTGIEPYLIANCGVESE